MLFDLLQRAILIDFAVDIIQITITKTDITSRQQDIVIDHTVTDQHAFVLGSLGKQEF